MGFLDYCHKYFFTRNLYELLKIPKTASATEVKKAYRSLSLLVHPDRVSEDQKEEATEKFKVLGKVHSILSDENKRAAYDENGMIQDGEDFEFDGVDWSEYWRALFKEITIDDIINYEKKYKGSEEELVDLKKAYVNGKGDMDFIVNHVPFTGLDDEPRIREIILGLIDQGLVESFDTFINEDPQKKLRRKRKLKREAREAEQIEKEMERKKQRRRMEKENGAGEESDLVMAIMKRKEQRLESCDKFLDQLAAKYTKPTKTTRPARKPRK